LGDGRADAPTGVAAALVAGILPWCPIAVMLVHGTWRYHADVTDAQSPFAR
jgi:hypothetical protein